MKKYIKKIAFLCAVLVGAMAIMGYSPDHQKVYDSAELFTSSQIDSLEEYAKKYGDEAKLDIIIYTKQEYTSGSAMQIADDFYDEHNFGWDDCDGSGAILLIDMSTREIYISTSGLAILYMDDEYIESSLDDIYEYATVGDYYSASKKFIDKVYDMPVIILITMSFMMIMSKLGIKLKTLKMQYLVR